MSSEKEEKMTEKEMFDNVITITAKNFKYAIENGTNNIATAVTTCVERYCSAVKHTNNINKDIALGNAILKLYMQSGQDEEKLDKISDIAKVMYNLRKEN